MQPMSLLLHDGWILLDISTKDAYCRFASHIGSHPVMSLPMTIEDLVRHAAKKMLP